MELQARKQALRQRIIAARENLAAAERRHLSQKITARLCAMPAYRMARTVLGYLNFGAELHTEAWVEQALQDGKRLLLPRVNRASRQLELYVVEDIRCQVAPGAWGIREPRPDCCEAFEALAELDFALLPGVAFSRDGGRLGYGGGYYDRLLQRLPHRPTLVAGAYTLQVLAEVPQEDTDRKVDWLVTEHETIRCNRERVKDDNSAE